MTRFLLIWIAVLLLSLGSCSRRQGTQRDVGSIQTEQNQIGPNVPSGLLVVDTAVGNTAEHRQLDLLEEHLFGRFFNDRAEFYVIKNPENKLFSSGVQSITMYYIDGVLGKTKYILTSSISADLISNYGNFRIAGLDSINKKLVRNRNILQSQSTIPLLDQRLNHFEMSWQKKDKIFLYRELRNDSARQFVFIEKLNDYDKRLRAVDVIF
ncbi:MAG: hypothetical protein ACK5V5_04710 [Cyclobacteriaceae bacterium]|jgi:hypothetical protein|nr:hypothetical protein [Flammeovirgaceae bacterium]